jgi:hypothetical protein
MGERTIGDRGSRQGAMESRLERIWEEGFAQTRSVADVFGPHEEWLLRIGGDLLLLHPILKEWLVLDRLHDAWKPTGFGPGEVVFTSQDGRLTFRRPKSAEEIESDGEISGGSGTAVAVCGRCGVRLPSGSRFCNLCGAAIGVPSPTGMAEDGVGADLARARLCGRCGASMGADKRFCTQCGAPLC